MAVVLVTLDITIDGQPLLSGPIVKRLETTSLQTFDYTKTNDGDTTTFTTLPDDTIAAIEALLVMPAAAMTVRLNGQSDAGIDLNAGGLLLIVDGAIDAGAGASNNKINNNSGAAAQVLGFGAGT